MISFSYCQSASSETLIGDAPSYVDINSCPEITQYVISQKKIPTDQIHSCMSKEEKIEDEDVFVVSIEYGQAQDCPAGCFYAQWGGAAAKDKSFIVELPNTHKVTGLLYSQDPFAQVQGRDYRCLNELGSITKFDLAKEAGNIGWRMKLTQPYICSWVKIEKTVMTYDSKLIHTGKVLKKTVLGSIFAYQQDGKIHWNFDNLNIHEEQGKEKTITDSL